MRLPQPPLPSAVRAEEATRIVRFLEEFDRQLEQRCDLCVYGSAAVSLYLADQPSLSFPMTDDVDVAQAEPSSSIEYGTEIDTLKFQAYSIEKWLVHPDWRCDAVDFSQLLRCTRLRLGLVHPVELIVSKELGGE